MWTVGQYRLIQKLMAQRWHKAANDPAAGDDERAFTGYWRY